MMRSSSVMSSSSMVMVTRCMACCGAFARESKPARIGCISSGCFDRHRGGWGAPPDVDQNRGWPGENSRRGKSLRGHGPPGDKSLRGTRTSGGQEPPRDKSLRGKGGFFLIGCGAYCRLRLLLAPCSDAALASA
jgi:hypothetical protein